jgi:hypothetical protein
MVLSHEGGVKRRSLQFDDDVAAQIDVVKEQVDVEVAAGKFKVHLPPDERKTAAQFDQEALDVVDQRLLDLALTSRVGGAEKNEEVGIFEYLLRHVGARGRHCSLKVGDCFALAFVGLSVYLQFEDISRPPILDCLLDVPMPNILILDSLEQAHDMTPWQL